MMGLRVVRAALHLSLPETIPLSFAPIHLVEGELTVVLSGQPIQLKISVPAFTISTSMRFGSQDKVSTCLDLVAAKVEKMLRGQVLGNSYGRTSPLKALVSLSPFPLQRGWLLSRWSPSTPSNLVMNSSTRNGRRLGRTLVRNAQNTRPQLRCCLACTFERGFIGSGR